MTFVIHYNKIQKSACICNSERGCFNTSNHFFPIYLNLAILRSQKLLGHDCISESLSCCFCLLAKDASRYHELNPPGDRKYGAWEAVAISQYHGRAEAWITQLTCQRSHSSTALCASSFCFPPSAGLRLSQAAAHAEMGLRNLRGKSSHNKSPENYNCDSSKTEYLASHCPVNSAIALESLERFVGIHLNLHFQFNFFPLLQSLHRKLVFLECLLS